MPKFQVTHRMTIKKVVKFEIEAPSEAKAQKINDVLIIDDIPYNACVEVIHEHEYTEDYSSGYLKESSPKQSDKE